MTRRLHSELTSDEVWYRLNVLLRDHAAWGRYLVRGELTDWGCRLWIAGMRMPLRLWTEEDPEGCAVCCRCAPSRGTPLAILLLLAVSLGAMAREWGEELPLRRLLPALALEAAALGGMLTLLLIVVPWLLTRRKCAALLAWVQAHLLTRELDGVLLPPPEVQRACWTGL